MSTTNMIEELGSEDGVVVEVPSSPPMVKSKKNLGNNAGILFCECFPQGLLKKVVSETISTYLLVFATCGAAAIHASDPTRISQLGQSIVGGLIVTVMIYSVGHISGAHMNPAVTIAFATFRHFPWKQVPFYAAAQFIGATCSAFTLRALLQPIKLIGTTAPSETHIQSLIMEIVVTFIMMFVTCAVATDSKAIGELAGLAIGSSVCITSVLAGPVSGGSMNPARTLGPAIASSHYKGLWIYFIGPVIGTLLGSWSYHIIRVTDKPLQAISAKSFSLRLRRMKRGNEDAVDNNIDFV